MAAQNDSRVIDDLRKSLAWLDLALATLNEGVVVLDGEMKIVFVNDAMAALVGRDPILLLGSFVWDVLDLKAKKGKLKKDTYETARSAKEIGSLSGSYQLGGSNHSVSVELSAAHISNTQHTVLVLRDESERLKAEAGRIKIQQEQSARKAAEISAERMRLQYSVSSILAGSIERRTAIMQIMETVGKSLGWRMGLFWLLDSPSNTLQCYSTWTDHIPSNNIFIKESKQRKFKKGDGIPGRVWERDAPIWAENVVRDLNFPRKAAADKVGLRGAFAIPVRSGNDFVGVMEFFTDRVESPDTELMTSMSTVGIQIAEFMRRKQVEKALKESETRLRFMADSMQHMIYTAQPNGVIDYCNPQSIKYAGVPFDELCKGGWLRLVHPDDLESSRLQWEASLKTGQPFQIERRLRRYDGTYRWHLSRAHALRDDNQDTILWIISDTDIEDIKRNVELEKVTLSLREQRAHLLELNSAKDEFISLASHQLRTPATGVKQFLGMLIEGYGGSLTEPQRIFAEKAYDSNERQITIVNDLLKVAQVDAGKVILKKADADMVDLVQNILDEQTSKFAERRQTVAYSHDHTMLRANVDVRNMRMAIENIVDNASKYTEPHRMIEVKVQKGPGAVVISVRDEGVGIAAEDMDRIFTKFSRVDNPLSVLVGGTGLGLYWSKKIIELHGGSISVESIIGKGTTFTVHLPLN